MSEINLQSVLDRLLKEDNEQATAILHKWFVEKCANINRGLLDEEVHVHVHQGADDQVSEDDDEDEDDMGMGGDDGMGENMSPISGAQDMDTDGDSGSFGDDSEMSPGMGDDGEMSPEGGDLDIEPDMDMHGGEEGGDVGLEDKVDDLQAELDDLKQKMIDQLGLEVDDDEDAMSADSEVDGDTEDDDSGSFGSDDEEGEEDSEGDEEEDDDSEGDDSEDDDSDEEEDDGEDSDKKNPFEDLEESFELERVADPHLDGNSTIGSDRSKFTKNDKSLIPGNTNVDGRVGGKPTEIHSEDYDGNERQASPAVKQTPLRKNQVKNAASDLEKVDSTGPKSALLNRKGDGYGSDMNDKSLIGSKGSVGNNKGFAR